MTPSAAIRSTMAARARELAGPSLTTKVRCLVRGYGLPRWGNLRRTTPFSATYGFDRGTPIDRYYLNQFLDMHRDLISGAVLEAQTDGYTERFGAGVTRADTFDIVPVFSPTYLCEDAAMTTVPFSGSAKAGLLASGWYANALEGQTFPGVLALCYHGIRASADDDPGMPFANLHVFEETFAAQCRMIAETCHPIDLATFCEARADGRELPRRPVLMTFDDGYRSVFELARPILLQHNIPATMFVCSEPIRDQRLFWFDAVASALGADAVNEARALPHEGWRAVARAHETPATAAPALAPMTDAQVRQLADEGFTIGVHTASHAPLAGASSDVQRRELQSCRAALEEWTGRSVSTLAYPFGAPRADYDDESVAVAGSLGFAAGFNTRSGFARPDEPPLERSRFVVLAAVTAAELAHRIAYAWPR